MSTLCVVDMWAGGIAAVAAAAVALVLLLRLPGNVPGGPSVAQAAVLATRPATEPAPAARADAGALLARSVERVPFPNWTAKFAWKAAGARTDTLGGRRATTVFCAKKGRRLGYTIFTGAALRAPADGRPVVWSGIEFRLLTLDGRRVVTWLRRGHTCILSDRGIDAATLTQLAVWKGRGIVPF